MRVPFGKKPEFVYNCAERKTSQLPEQCSVHSQKQITLTLYQPMAYTFGQTDDMVELAVPDVRQLALSTTYPPTNTSNGVLKYQNRGPSTMPTTAPAKMTTKGRSQNVHTSGNGGGAGEYRFDARYKVLLLGNSGVGKTSILQTLMGEPFNPGTISTIGIDLAKKIFIVENNRIQLEICVGGDDRDEVHDDDTDDTNGEDLGDSVDKTGDGGENDDDDDDDGGDDDCGHVDGVVDANNDGDDVGDHGVNDPNDDGDDEGSTSVGDDDTEVDDRDVNVVDTEENNDGDFGDDDYYIIGECGDTGGDFVVSVDYDDDIYYDFLDGDDNVHGVDEYGGDDGNDFDSDDDNDDVNDDDHKSDDDGSDDEQHVDDSGDQGDDVGDCDVIGNDDSSENDVGVNEANEDVVSEYDDYDHDIHGDYNDDDLDSDGYDDFDVGGDDDSGIDDEGDRYDDEGIDHDGFNEVNDDQQDSGGFDDHDDAVGDRDFGAVVVENEDDDDDVDGADIGGLGENDNDTYDYEDVGKFDDNNDGEDDIGGDWDDADADDFDDSDVRDDGDDYSFLDDSMDVEDEDDDDDNHDGDDDVGDGNDEDTDEKGGDEDGGDVVFDDLREDEGFSDDHDSDDDVVDNTDTVDDSDHPVHGDDDHLGDGHGRFAVGDDYDDNGNDYGDGVGGYKIGHLSDQTSEALTMNIQMLVSIHEGHIILDKQHSVSCRDTAGQEQYYSIVALHFREAKAFIVVYDVTDPRTFEQIRKYWLRSVDQHMDEPVPVFFAANKADLSAQRKVTLEEGEKAKHMLSAHFGLNCFSSVQLASQQCAHGHFETSAKTGLNVINLFQHVAESMVSTWGAPKRWYEMDSQDDQGNHWPNQVSGRQTVQLTYSTEKPKKRQCCQTK
ncbi:uncharacterized protein DEA37_0007730 [Paragonimus westermani]|uniref:Uncharacterized protein n=1 Tax=Paragonimus westermani TaxID=34504 RepID=A0A5J4NYX2_9TREM|nr:uncharacterized protein DEA37_0007730 [Paragonimus westermani]